MALEVDEGLVKDRRPENPGRSRQKKDPLEAMLVGGDMEEWMVDGPMEDWMADEIPGDDHEKGDPWWN